jgi:hypothetical protein
MRLSTETGWRLTCCFGGVDKWNEHDEVYQVEVRRGLSALYAELVKAYSGFPAV